MRSLPKIHSVVDLDTLWLCSQVYRPGLVLSVCATAELEPIKEDRTVPALSLGPRDVRSNQIALYHHFFQASKAAR